MKSIEQIFGESFPDGGTPESMTYQKTPGWDSLAHMVLCAKIEDNFDIMLEISDIAEMSSFARAKQIVEKHCGKK